MVGGESNGDEPRRFGSYEVVATIAPPRSGDGSTLFVAIARGASARRDTSGKLALSFSPSSPNEPTKTVQRPVVIKQLSPSLTADPAKLDAFLEAARITTTLRHGNVSEIESVGTEAGDVYLVSDYLLGETAATLLRRLQSEGDRLKPPLAAYVAREVAAALDAGHSAGLVHGHLTPHDVFIGYDGSVRLFDIGIADARTKLASARISGVELEYASPEVCRHETTDPRTDVFSLGVIMWELFSGLSPFERAADADVVRAICDDSVVPPKNIVPGMSRELSAVTLQALHRDRGERFQTATALGHALEEIVKKSIVGPPADHLSKVMKKLFATREADKREMLKRVPAGTPIAGLDITAIDRSTAPARLRPPPPPPPVLRAPEPPPPDPDEPTSVVAIQTAMTPARSRPPAPGEEDQPSVIVKGASLPALPVATLVSTIGTLPSSELVLEPSLVAAAPAPNEPPASPPSARPVTSAAATDDLPPIVPGAGRGGAVRVIAVVGALVGVVLVLVVLLRHRGDAGPNPNPKLATPAAPASTIAGIPVAPATAIASATPPPVPAPEPTSSPAPAPPSSTPADEQATLHIETVPSQASIFVAGAKKGSSPLELQVARGAEPITIEIRHAGYATLKERVVPDMNQRLKLTLVASGGTTKPPAPAPNPYKKFE